MLSLIEFAKRKVEDEYWIFSEKSDDIDKYIVSLWLINQSIGIAECFENKNLPKSKQHFYLCGRLDEYAVNNFNDRFLMYAFQHPCYAVLSDAEDMIQRYANLKFTQEGTLWGMEKIIASGDPMIHNNNMQLLMKQDWDGLARNLNILELKKIKEKKSRQWEVPCYDFAKALYDKDKQAAEEALAQMVTPKYHKMRNDDPLLSQYISQPALGYAKLAWRCGIEVEVNSPLVPKELLPVMPNEKYEDVYEFLKENSI